MRMRSPRIAPPLNGEFGSVAITATERSSFRTDGSRFSTRLIARARARMSPEPNRWASAWTGSLSSSAIPATREVVPQHDHQSVSLLTARRRCARRRRWDDARTEKCSQPSGCKREPAVGVIEDHRLSYRAVHNWIVQLQACGVEHGRDAAHQARAAAVDDLDRRLLVERGRWDE